MLLSGSEIEFFSVKGKDYGIVENYPAVIRVSDLIKNIFQLGKNDTDEKHIISLLEKRYAKDDILQALKEIKELNASIKKVSFYSWDNKKVVNTVYIDLPKDTEQAIGIIFNSIELLSVNEKNLFVILNAKYESIDQVMKILEKNLTLQLSSKINFSVRLPISYINQTLVKIIKIANLNFKLLFDCDKDVYPFNPNHKNAIQSLCSRWWVSLSILNLRASVFLHTLVNDAKTLGIELFELDSSGCECLNNNYNLLGSNNNKNNIDGFTLYDSDIIKYVGTLYDSTPKRYFCGAGKWYWAVSESGKIYPCHKFIDVNGYNAGTINDFTLDNRLYESFVNACVENKNGCTVCWSKFICGGGCLFNSFSEYGSIFEPDYKKCDNTKSKIRSAASLSAEEAQITKILLKRNVEINFLHFPFYFTPDLDGKIINKVFKTVGNSMHPLFVAGTELKISIMHANRLKAGDIFSYILNNKIITHRLILKINIDNNIYFIEKGDNAFFKEVGSGQVIGKIISFKRPGSESYFSTQNFLSRISGLLIVMNTISIWLCYTLIRYTPIFIYNLFKGKFKIQTALKYTFKERKYEVNPKFLINVFNAANKVVGYITLFLYEKGTKIWNLRSI